MKLHLAEFCFETHKVVFVGQMIAVYESGHGCWNMIYERENPWDSRARREDDGVMGRAYKPRITDAMEILRGALKKLEAVHA